MSVNIYDGTSLTPIAGKTVPAPTPDYVDEQFNPSTTYSKGMTCIEGNVRYRYKNSTATSGHRPPDTTYWEVDSVSNSLFSNMTLIQGIESQMPNSSMGTGWTYSGRIGNGGGDVNVGNISMYKYLLLNYYRKTNNGYTLIDSSVLPTNKIPYATNELAIQRNYCSAWNGGQITEQYGIYFAGSLANTSLGEYYYYYSSGATASRNTYRLEIYGIK